MGAKSIQRTNTDEHERGCEIKKKTAGLQLATPPLRLKCVFG